MALPVKAATEDSIQLPAVMITYSPSFQNIYGGGGSEGSYGAILDSPYYGMSYIMFDYYMEYLDFVADAKANPMTTPDVRCNLGATQETRTTTSLASVTDRFLAAQQLFAFIRGVDNAASLRALVRSSGSYFFNSARQFTFQVTYADGGKEQWIVASILTGALVNEGNVPNSLALGNGIVQGCTATG